MRWFLFIVLAMASGAGHTAPLASTLVFTCPSAVAGTPLSSSGSAWPSCPSAKFVPAAPGLMVDINNLWQPLDSAAATAQVWTCPKGATLNVPASGCFTDSTLKTVAAVGAAKATLGPVAPPAPSYTANLKWTATTLGTDNKPVTMPVTYNVYLGSNKIQSGIAGTQSTAPNLPAGQACFTVTAVNPAGESVPSPSACITEPVAKAVPPIAPGVPVVTPAP